MNATAVNNSGHRRSAVLHGLNYHVERRLIMTLTITATAQALLKLIKRGSGKVQVLKPYLAYDFRKRILSVYHAWGRSNFHEE